jgi:hypothetical protein
MAVQGKLAHRPSLAPKEFPCVAKRPVPVGTMFGEDEGDVVVLFVGAEALESRRVTPLKTPFPDSRGYFPARVVRTRA